MTKRWAAFGVLLLLCGLSFVYVRPDGVAMDCLTSGDGPLMILTCRQRVLPIDAYRSIWTDVVAKSPDMPLGYVNLAREYHLAGNRVYAQLNYQRAMDRAAMRADYRSRDILVLAQSNLAVLMIEAGEDEQAELTLRAALSLSPNHGPAISYLALLLNRQQRFGETIELIDGSLEAGFGPGFASFAAPLYMHKAAALCSIGLIAHANVQFDYAATHFADIEPVECKPPGGF